MTIPTILSGAAGRALNTLKPLDDMVSHVDDVIGNAGAWTGVNFDVRARTVLHPTWLDVGEARSVINAAGDDITKALGGTRKPAFSSEMHAATRNLQGQLNPVNGPVTATPHQVLSSSGQVRAGLDELQAAASSTARKRVIIGSLALGGGLAGLLALSGAASGGGSQPMAPGPIGEHGSSSGGGTQA